MPPGSLPSALGRRIVKRTCAGSGEVARVARGKTGELGAVAGPPEAGLADQGVGLREERLGLLAGVGDEGVGAGAGVGRNAGAVEPVNDSGEVAGPAIEEVGRAAAKLATLVGRQQEADGHTGGTADEEPEDGGADGAATLAHGRGGGTGAMGRGR